MTNSFCAAAPLLHYKNKGLMIPQQTNFLKLLFQGVFFLLVKGKYLKKKSFTLPEMVVVLFVAWHQASSWEFGLWRCGGPSSWRGILIGVDYVERQLLRWHRGRGNRFLQPCKERIAQQQQQQGGPRPAGREVYEYVCIRVFPSS